MTLEIELRYFFFSKLWKNPSKNNVDPYQEKIIYGSLEFEHVLGVALQISKFGRIFFIIILVLFVSMYLCTFFIDSIIRTGRSRLLEFESKIVLVV